MSDITRKLKKEEFGSLGNFKVEIKKNGFDKIYFYKNIDIFNDAFYGKSVGEVDLNTVRGKINTLNEIKNEVKDLSKKFKLS